MLVKLATLYGRWFMSTIEYRAELFLWILHDLVPTVVLIFVWSQLYQNTTTHGIYTLPDVLQYYLLVVLVSMLTGVHFEQFRAQEVRNGKIDHFFTRPIGYFWEITIGALANKTFYLILSAPMIGLLWLVVDAIFHLNGLQPTLGQVGVFSLLLIGAYLIEFILSLLVVIISFWLEGAEGLAHFKWLAVSIFSGWMIPVYLMPDWLQRIVAALPFQYMYAIPISVLQGKATVSLQELLYYAISIGALCIVTMFLWRKALYQYASAGG